MNSILHVFVAIFFLVGPTLAWGGIAPFVPRSVCDFKLVDLHNELPPNEAIINPFRNHHYVNFRVTAQQMIIRKLSEVMPLKEAEILFARFEHRFHEGTYIKIRDGAIQEIWVADGSPLDRNLMTLQHLTEHIGKTIQRITKEKEKKRLDRAESPPRRPRATSLYDAVIRQMIRKAAAPPVVLYGNPYINSAFVTHQSYVRQRIMPILTIYFRNPEKAFEWCTDRIVIAVEGDRVIDVFIRAKGRSNSLTWFEGRLAAHSAKARTPRALMKGVLGNLSLE